MPSATTASDGSTRTNNYAGSSAGSSASSNSQGSKNAAGAATFAGTQTAVASRAPARLEPASSTCDCRAAVAAAAGPGGDGAPSPTTTTTRTTSTKTARVHQPSLGDASGAATAVTGNSSKGEPETEPEGGAVDVCTVGDLYPWRNMYGVTGRQELLRLGFLRQQVIRCCIAVAPSNFQLVIRIHLFTCVTSRNRATCKHSSRMSYSIHTTPSTAVRT